MSSPQVLPPAAPEIHPEFGYLWPAAHNRRTVGIALKSTAFGALLGLVAALVMTSRAPNNGAQTATALSAVPADEARAESVSVQTAAAPVVTPQTPVASTEACSEQTWPYLDAQCLSKNKSRSKREPVRILKPEAPAQSVPAQVVQMPEPEVTAAAKAEASPRVSKKRDRSAKRRQREFDRETAYSDRGRYDRNVDPRSAYATPYPPPYEMRRGGWDW